MAMVILFLLFVVLPVTLGVIWYKYYLPQRVAEREVKQEIDSLPPLIKEAVRSLEQIEKTKLIPDDIKVESSGKISFTSLNMTVSTKNKRVSIVSPSGQVFSFEFFTAQQHLYINRLILDVTNIAYEATKAKQRMELFNHFNTSFSQDSAEESQSEIPPSDKLSKP